MTFLKDMLLPHFIQFLELPTTVSLFLCPQYVVWEVSKWLQLGQSSSPDFSGSLVRKFSFFSSQKTIEKGAQDFQVRYSGKFPCCSAPLPWSQEPAGAQLGRVFPCWPQLPSLQGQDHRQTWEAKVLKFRTHQSKGFLLNTRSFS